MQLPNQILRKPPTKLKLPRTRSSSPTTAVALGFTGVVIPMAAIIYHLLKIEKESELLQEGAAHVGVSHQGAPMYLPIL